MKMILTRGLPGSGKTTWAKKQEGFIRINRDNIREMLFTEVLHSAEQEEQVTVIQHGAIKSALKAGNNVMIDDTNLNPKNVRQLMKIAQSFGAEVEFKDFIDVSLHECIRRDYGREQMGERTVGEKIINGMHNSWIKGRTELPIPVLPTYELKPYVAPSNGTPAVICDIDGTVAKMSGRSPYDWKRVGEDSPVEDVLETVHAMELAGYWVLFTSGRDAVCRSETNWWLITNYQGTNWTLLMREEKDNRPDWIVKAEIFDKEIRDKYNVRCVFDDRNQVVSMWRKIGLTVMQVAEGEF